jgi:hypothetical protein
VRRQLCMLWVLTAVRVSMCPPRMLQLVRNPRQCVPYAAVWCMVPAYRCCKLHLCGTADVCLFLCANISCGTMPTLHAEEVAVLLAPALLLCVPCSQEELLTS